MKNISIIIIILCIIGCAGTKGKKRTVKDSRHKSEFSAYSQHWNTGEDSLNLFLHMRLPLKQFVFRKSSDHFYSNITYTLVISNAEKNTQVYRESWNEKVIQPYYEDTRNPDNYFTTERNITLIPGHYKLFLNVQDEDSRINWQLNKEFELEPIHILGPPLTFIKNEDLQKIVAANIIEDTDTIWLRTQVYLQDSVLDKIEYKISRKTTIIDSGIVNIMGAGINNLYYLPIPLNKAKQGLHKITLSFKGIEHSIKINYGIARAIYWTEELDELVGVMQYIFLDHSEYKKLKELDISSQWDYIYEYWKERDPSPKTSKNELLIQLNERVNFVNKNFSILRPGWKTDRGRIYIVYGRPQYIDESYRDEMGYTYQKWGYPSGKQFIFIDRNMSGNYSLYQEI